jgi:hypothetical protein
MTAQLIVTCPYHLAEVRSFADQTNQREQFERQLDRLTDHLPDGWTVELYSDFAPHSFFWTQSDPKGQGGLIGGLIYHGRHDEEMVARPLFQLISISPTVGEFTPKRIIL